MATDYGIDLWGYEDLDQGLNVVTGPLAVAHGVARRLLTPRGALWYAPDYGYDIRGLLHDDVAQEGLVEANIEAEALKDDRVLGCVASVARSGELLTVSVRLELDEGPFALVLNVSQLNVELLFAAA